MAKESHGFSYDVFISFRGEDTRYTFIGYLRDGLERKRIKIFRDDDDDDLRIGEDISPTISKAIEESNILIVVLSVNYASSKWCLDELVKILDCRKRNNKQFVFPIFYHVDPSEVRYQRNSYGQAMTKHEDRLGKNSVETWKSALSEICSLKGLHITTAKGYEIKLIEQIVQKVYDKLDSKPLHVGQDPVGLVHCTEKERLKKEQEEKEHKTKEKTEAHLYTIIKLARDEDLREQIGNDIDYGLVVHDKVKSFRVRKQLSFNHFKEEVAKEFGIPVQFQRFWLWTKRADHSYHPDRPLTHDEEAQSVGQLSLLSNEVHDGELNMFLEVELGQDSRLIAPPDKTKDDILLFFKLYDPAKKKKLRYVGRLLVKSTSKPSEILKRLNEMAGYDPDEEIELCQEVWFSPNNRWEPIDMNLTFHESQLQDGDIVGFQKATPTDDEEDVSHPDVPSHTELECNGQERLKEEKEEKEHKTKKRTEAHLYTMIKVARDEDLAEHIKYGLVEHDKVRSFHVPKQISFNLFKEEVAKEFGIPVQFQRFWLWTKRADHSYHPDRPLTHDDKAQSVGQLSLLSNEVHHGELKLFLEVELGLDLRPIAPPEKTKDDILLFFKLYDPVKEELRYVGRLFVKSTSKPSKILRRLNEMAGYDLDEEIELYEEVWFNPNDLWKPIDKKLTFHASELQDGDIVCFRKAAATDNEEHVSHPDVPPFTELEHNGQERLKEEKEEKEHKTKKRTEAHLYTIIKVARDEDLAEQIGNDIEYGLVEHDKVRSFRVPKQISFNLFKEDVAKEFGIPVQFQRFWLWAKRPDHSYHPDRPLTQDEEAQSVGQLSLLSNEVHDGELNLFLEVELGQDSRPMAPPDKTKDDILLFFKLYDPAKKKKLRYVGRLLVKSTSKPSEILKRLNEMAGYDPDEEIELCQEVWFNPNDLWKRIDEKLTFHASELQDGDIVGFWKASATDNKEHVSHPDVPSNTELEHNGQNAMMTQQRAIGNDRFLPMIHASPPPMAVVNHMYPPPGESFDFILSDENTSSCNVM